MAPPDNEIINNSTILGDFYPKNYFHYFSNLVCLPVAIVSDMAIIKAEEETHQSNLEQNNETIFAIRLGKPRQIRF